MSSNKFQVVVRDKVGTKDMKWSKRQIDMKKLSGSEPSRYTAEKMVNRHFHYTRYVFSVLAGFAVGLSYFTRLGISVVIVDMVVHRDDDGKILNDHPEKFHWTNEVQQIITGSYMVAFALPQLPLTRMAMKYGVRHYIAISLITMGLSCILTPAACQVGWPLVVALRLLNGLSGSAMLPCSIELIQSWFPFLEAPYGLAALQFTEMILIILAPLVSGRLAAVHWSHAFYWPGVVCISFAIIWWVLARDKPSASKFVSDKELAIIQEPNSSDKQVQDETDKELDKHDPASTPWYVIFKYPDMCVLAICWTVHCISFSGFLFLMPNYFKKIMQLSIETNGMYNFVVASGVLFSMLWTNPLISLMMRFTSISLTNARKVCVAFYPSMTIITFLYVGIYHENQIVLLTINRFFESTSDMMITSTTMSRFGALGLSGMAYSVANTFGNLFTLIFSWVSGRFLDIAGNSRESWFWIYLALCIINATLLVVYILFANSEPLKPKKSKENKSNAIENA